MAKILIVGGVAGGASTAARLRRIDEKAEIILFERGEYISYANCGLPYYIGDVIKERQKLFVQTPQSFGKRFNIDIRVFSEVISINRIEKSIEVKELKSGKIYNENYDKLVLSPGAEPIKPNIPGIDDKAIFTLRNVPDTDKIKNYINEVKPKSAVVIGAGFIGLEMAENLYHLGIDVTIVEMANQVMIAMDYEIAANIHHHIRYKKVKLILSDAVSSFKREGEKFSVILKSGKEIMSDMAILSIGVRPENKLAKDAGLKIGIRGGIEVNEYLQTSDENIYAVGDAIEFENPLTGKETITYLAGPANKQGRTVANNIVLGNKQKYTGAIGTAIAKIFDITAASAGLNKKILDAEKIPYSESIIFSSSHAGYYPEASPMIIKILFSSETGVLYGAQIIGKDGADKRIDVFSMVIKNKGTIYDLQEFEQAYAPPYSSAKDPVNIAGFTAANIYEGLCNVVQWYDMDKFSEDKDAFLLDVRTPSENSFGNIKNSCNIPVDDLRKRINEIPKDKKIIVYCAAGLRGYLAARVLKQSGFERVYNLSGGYQIYKTATQN